MLFRFSLYGFLKNQRYFEPFLILVFLAHGFSFFAIGLLVAFREICRNLFEIPSGVVADVYGRRRCMVLSLSAYCVSFVIFAQAQELYAFFGAMLFFAVGDAFRTGTHKAIINAWLRHEGREQEQLSFYGITRGWSKIGSAVSVIIGVALVLATGNYSFVFWGALPAYFINIVNLLTYPKFLDGRTEGESLKSAWLRIKKAAIMELYNRRLRRLVAESAGFSGVYNTVKEYLQPILKHTALLLPVFMDWKEPQRIAVVVGVVYVLLALLEGLASRQAHAFQRWTGGTESSARNLWILAVMAYGLLTLSFVFSLTYVVIILFLMLAVLHNLWRPIQVSRYSESTRHEVLATVLSVDSQADSLTAAILAPLLGLSIDLVKGAGQGFWPLGVVGAFAGLLVLAAFYRTFTEKAK